MISFWDLSRCNDNRKCWTWDAEDPMKRGIQRGNEVAASTYARDLEEILSIILQRYRRTITCVCTTLNSRSPLQCSSSQGCYIKSKRVDSVVGKPIITIISVVELRGCTLHGCRGSFSNLSPSSLYPRLSFLPRMFITRRRRGKFFV